MPSKAKSGFWASFSRGVSFICNEKTFRSKGLLKFEVECDETKPGECVIVVGSGSLGGWEVANGLILDGGKFPRWVGQTTVEGFVEFKYAIASIGTAPSLLRWEGDFANRTADFNRVGISQLTLRHRFGDPLYTSIKVVAEPSEATTKVPVTTDGQETIDQVTPQKDPSPYPSPADFKLAADLMKTASQLDLLQDLEVEPSLKLTRIFKSKSGLGFSLKYELKQDLVLGEGMSGGVFVATERDTGKMVAVKTLRIQNQVKREHMISEVQHQLSMDHPHICRLLEVYEEKDKLLLVMEKLGGPDLFSHLSKKGRYFEKDAQNYVRQITSAVAYCHRNGVCHRDLKLDNFCFEDDSDDARIKMIDFGLSEAINDEMPMTDCCGTLYYVAPEVLAGEYNEKCDMWSLGVLSYILLDGRAPFMGKNDRATYLLIRSGKFTFDERRWANISPEARDFVSSCLQVDPTRRLSADEALAHPWLVSVCDEADLPELDTDVIDGLRNFGRGNKLKQAILCALAPLATVEDVGRWADQFEALDTGCTGTVSVKDFAERLAKSTTNEKEANSLLEALAIAGGSDSCEEISYSAFLAACLCAHKDPMEDKRLRELFSKLDTKKTGLVEPEEIVAALGDIVDIKAITEEFGNRGISYNDFQWLLHRPVSISGLRQLLGSIKGTELAPGWRVATKTAKDKFGGNADAARKENAAWRHWHRQQLRAAAGEHIEDDDALSPQTTGHGVPMSSKESGCSETSSTSPTSFPAVPDAIQEVISDIASQDSATAWQLAAAQAKEGDFEAVRRENLAWRIWNREQSKGSSRAPSPEDRTLSEPLRRNLAKRHHVSTAVST